MGKGVISMGFDYQFGYADPGAIVAFNAVLGVLRGLTSLTALLSIATYVLSSLGLYTIAKRRGVRCYGLAWVPVANLWILGSISDQYKYVTAGKVQKRRCILLGLNIAGVVLTLGAVAFAAQFFVAAASGYGDYDYTTMQSVGGMLILWLLVAVVDITLAVYEYITLYNLYHSCMPGNATLFLVLSIFFHVTTPFFLFACRNKDEGMPQRFAQVEEAAATREPWEN